MSESASTPTTDLDKRLKELETGLDLANRRVSTLTKVALLSAAISAALVIAIFVPAVAPKIAKLQAGHLVVDRVSLIRGTVATDITPGLVRVTSGAVEARIAIAHSSAEVTVQGDTLHRAKLSADADSATIAASDTSPDRFTSMELYAASKQGAWLKGKQQTLKGKRNRTIEATTVTGPSLRLFNVEKDGTNPTTYGFDARTDELRGKPLLKLTGRDGDTWQESSGPSLPQPGASADAKPAAKTPKPGVTPQPATGPKKPGDHGF